MSQLYKVIIKTNTYQGMISTYLKHLLWIMIYINEWIAIYLWVSYV